MSGGPSTERLFSMACFEGLRLLRRYGQRYPNMKTAELKDIIIKVEADARNLDMEAAVYLHPNVTPGYQSDSELFYQECIKVVIVTCKPIWAKLMWAGRMQFIDSLEANPKSKDDDIDIFTAAGLLQKQPSEAIVTWWDGIVSHTRQVADIEKMIQARKAEKLTLEHEKQRLNNIGIRRSPEWKGFENNYAGYDVLSFDLKDGVEINVMIEVKSTIASPIRFYLSRNEWNKANEIGEVYIFHIWDMSAEPPRLYKRTVEQVKPHIPSDNKKGKWLNAEIPLGI